MKTVHRITIFLSLCLLTLGCAVTETMVNTSTIKEIPPVNFTQPIPASILVQSEDPASNLPNDVSMALQEHKVFTNVSSARAGGTTGDLVLIVSGKTESDSHFAAGMGKAVLSGLTLGIGKFHQTDPYDYSITINAKLQKGETLISEYETMGSFHSEISEHASVSAKTERVKNAIQLSYNHALALLVTKLKQDRAKIMSALDK